MVAKGLAITICTILDPAIDKVDIFLSRECSTEMQFE